MHRYFMAPSESSWNGWPRQLVVRRSPNSTLGLATSNRFLPHRVEAPRAAAGRRDVEPQETVQDRRLAQVVDGPQEPTGRVDLEVREGHLARHQKRRGPREQ